MATYYVSTTGSDSGTGSLASPFATFSHASSVMSAADLLYVRGGTYTEGMIDLFPSGTSSTAKTRIVGYPGDAIPHIEATAGGNWCLWVGSKSDQSYEGLHFHGPSAAIDAVKLTNTASRIDLVDCEVHSGPDQGILMTGTGSGHTILRGEVSDNGVAIPGFGHGIYVSVTDVIIDGANIHDCVGHGIHAYGGDPSRLIVRNCKIYGNSNDAGVGFYTGDSMVCYNNLIWDCYYGLRIGQYGATNAAAYFNTIYGCAQGVRILAPTEQGSATTIYENNIAFGNTYDFYGGAVQGAALNAICTTNMFYVLENLSGYPFTYANFATLGNIRADPLFVDAAANDFHLQGTSPAIGAGINVGVTTDYDGLVRIMPPSIGAFDITNRAPSGGGGGTPRGSRAYRRGFDPVISRPIPRSGRAVDPVTGDSTPRGRRTYRRG